VYHLEGEGIIWSSRESSGWVCIIWKGRVSYGTGEYHLGVYYLAGEGIIWSSRVSSGGGVYHLIIYRERVLSRVGEYHLEGAFIIWKGRDHPEQESII
jgi:hypothetical protein